LSKEAFNRRFEELYAANQVWPSTLVVVILDENERVATTGTLLLERKFLRAAAIAGHIEDIAVRPDQQGKGLGRLLIEALTGIAQRQGCYKVILDCEERNVPFYEKCAYERAGVEMKKYL
jgi:glucosamine-phosphate N-acetyltransferase